MPFLMLTLCLPASRRGSAGQGFFCEVKQGRGGNSIFLTHLYAQSIVNHTLMIVAYGPELAPYCTHPTIDAAVISLGILVLGLCVFLQEQPLYSFLQKLLHFLHSHQHKNVPVASQVPSARGVNLRTAGTEHIRPERHPNPAGTGRPAVPERSGGTGSRAGTARGC